MLHPWFLHAALLVALFSVAVSLHTFVSPLAAARNHGFDLGSSSAAGGPGAGLAFVPIFGGRNLAVALAMFAFYWQRWPKALGTVLLCCTVSAVVDVVVTSRWGMEGMAWQHVGGAVVLGVVGWGLVV